MASFDVSQLSRLQVIDHPLVQHKLSILRDRDTSTKQFRDLVHEISLFIGYEATRDFPIETIMVTSPMETTLTMRIAGKKVALIPILRAGLGMVDGLLELVPSARVGHVGLYRDPITKKPQEYYCKLPSDVEERTCMILDPMLATGGSASAAVQFLRDSGVKDVRLLSIIAAPEGVERVLMDDPDVRIYLASVDRELDENAYILPGLGDAGDRLFGTK